MPVEQIQIVGKSCDLLLTRWIACGGLVKIGVEKATFVNCCKYKMQEKHKK
jgi:hypothetical protein